MGLLDILEGNTVYFDTAPIIYYVEDIAPYADLFEPVFQAVKLGSLRTCTATLTLAMRYGLDPAQEERLCRCAKRAEPQS